MNKFKSVKTSDEFYSTYPDGTVTVSVLRIRRMRGDKSWRVCVWGDDDYGLEKANLQIDDAFTLYRSISDGVTIAGLKKLGFIQA